MVDATTAIISAVLAGLAGGFISSWLSFNASGEKFDGRKHGNGLVTGALAGMGLGLLLVIAAEVANKGEIPGTTFAVGLFSIFLAAAGVDAFRSKAKKMLTDKGLIPPSTTTTTPPSPPSPAPSPTK